MRAEVSPEWTRFYDRVERKANLDLRLYKQDQMQRRILSLVDSKGLRDLPGLANYIESDREAMRWMLDKLAINVSELFRNPEKWAELEKQVLPMLLKRSSRLKCWSAGCSYGAEAYTLATVLQTMKCQYSVLGTDIDETAMAQARLGEFSHADVRGVPERYRSNFEQAGDKWLAKASLKQSLRFQRGNLLADPFDTNYDLILCRNVVIYFTEGAKDQLFRRFYDALKPGGVLFVGSTERIFSARQIGFECSIPFFYQRPLEGHQTWRNAS